MIFLNWNFEIKIDELPQEAAKEIFVIGNPGSIPMSVKIPLSNFADLTAEESQKKIDELIEHVKNNVKVAFAKSMVQELQNLGIIKSDKISAT